MRTDRCPLWIPAMLVLALASPAAADPCGMVPPVFIGDGPAITRVGAQRTYVFYKDGVETFCIHPAFSGKVEDFGMLIPFPSPPAMRKVDDALFEHIACAIDPPEVVVDLRPPMPGAVTESAGVDPDSPDSGLSLRNEDEVRVLREEAIGMYEVVVLEAGSAAALNRWMTGHGYTYPEGMDEACNDYIEEGWCFVAVKTRVGPKSGVDPHPGQRDVDPGLPPGASFDGAVQAMGFRFRVDRLVVPMRLSSFNEGELHNIVYILSDEPLAIDRAPQSAVRRQISGEQLYRNVTGLLPLRVLGGTVEELRASQPDRLRRIDAMRDPVPHNGKARDLFAGDLLAVSSGQLSHPHEERAKVLLQIDERLGLRGPEIDEARDAALAHERHEAFDAALEDLHGMTLTVWDGVFERAMLAAENLTFHRFDLPAEANTIAAYNAVREGEYHLDGVQQWDWQQWVAMAGRHDGGHVVEGPVAVADDDGAGPGGSDADSEEAKRMPPPSMRDGAPQPADGTTGLSGGPADESTPMNLPWLIAGIAVLVLAVAIAVTRRR